MAGQQIKAMAQCCYLALALSTCPHGTETGIETSGAAPTNRMTASMAGQQFKTMTQCCYLALALSTCPRGTETGMENGNGNLLWIRVPIWTHSKREPLQKIFPTGVVRNFDSC